MRYKKIKLDKYVEANVIGDSKNPDDYEYFYVLVSKKGIEFFPRIDYFIQLVNSDLSLNIKLFELKQVCSEIGKFCKTNSAYKTFGVSKIISEQKKQIISIHNEIVSVFEKKSKELSKKNEKNESKRETRREVIKIQNKQAKIKLYKELIAKYGKEFADLCFTTPAPRSSRAKLIEEMIAKKEEHSHQLSSSYYSVKDENSLQIMKVATAKKSVKPVPLPENMFRYARHSELGQVLQTVAKSDYRHYQDFKPFLSDGSGDALAIPCQISYGHKMHTIYIYGWYMENGIVKIRWFPNYTEAMNRRSSGIYIDIKTQKLFFSGQVFDKDSRDPVFLENIFFEGKKIGNQMSRFEASFTNFWNKVHQLRQENLIIEK